MKNPKNNIKLIFVFLLLIYSLFFIAGGVLAPLAAHYKFFSQADALYVLFHKSCNQDALRCFWILGYQMAICARCLGAYIGTAGVFGFYLTGGKVNIQIYILSALVGFGEILYEALKFQGTNNYTRLIAGIFLGVFTGQTMIHVIDNIGVKKNVQKIS